MPDLLTGTCIRCNERVADDRLLCRDCGRTFDSRTVRSLTVPTHDGESEGRCVYEVRWGETVADAGGGEPRDVAELYVLERPDGIRTGDLEEECWADFDAYVRRS